MMNETSIEAQRSRWRRTRASFHLDDPNSEDFSTGGLAKLAAKPSLRLFILPSDPENISLEFDEDFWAWWLTKRPDAADGRSEGWPHEFPTSNAAIRHTGTERELTSYLALHRNCGFELELGNSGAISNRDNIRCFRLTYAVGQMWSAFTLYQEVTDRFNLSGPWEISCALCNTSGALLSNFAEGWAEPGQSFLSEIRTLAEPNLLWRREMHEWPNADGIKELAFSFGGWMEDAWGHRERRFLSQRGSLFGQFDTAAYRR